MSQEPFYVLTEGIGVGIASIAIISFFLLVLYGILRDLSKHRFKHNSIVKSLIFLPSMIIIMLLLFLLAYNFIIEKLQRRPMLEFFQDGICHYDLDRSNKYYAWLNVENIFYCSYPHRSKKGVCSDGEMTPQNAPSFNRGIRGVKIRFKSCDEGECSVFIDSMYMSGFREYLEQQVNKANKAVILPQKRTCDTLPEGQLSPAALR